MAAKSHMEDNLIFVFVIIYESVDKRIVFFRKCEVRIII